MRARLTLQTALLLLGFGACENDLNEVRKFMPPAANVEMARGVELLYSDSAVVTVRITAPLVLTYSEPKKHRREFPEGLKMEFLNERQEVTSYVVAKRATRYEAENRVELRDSVVMWNARSDERLEAQELSWDEVREVVTTDRFVKIRKADEIIMGYGLLSNLEFTRWSLEKVTAVLKTNSLINVE